MKQVLLTLLLLLGTVVQAQDALPTDSAVRMGKLPNGLTYYIRYNNWPEHRANFYIAQKVGSIQEEESQRGLAHFLEHMCFNGTEHFKGNDLIRYLESIGVQFGSDLNAYTSIDQTVYNIDNVPTARQSALDSCLLILHDWATALTLDPAEIDKERGVIHEEWRMRTSAASRMFERNLEKLYPGSKYGKRYPIGLMSVVDNFKPKELRDYYEKWYHPANQGIIVVGDVDIDHVEAMIKKIFGDIKNPDNMAPIVDEPVPDNATPIVIVDKDKEYRTSDVQLMVKHDAVPDNQKQSVNYIASKYVIAAATGMLRDRYTEAAQKADCPYVSTDVSYDSYIFAKTKDAFSIDVNPKDMTLTATALKEALVEARRAAKFGFTATEFDRYKANYLSMLDKQYSNRDKRYTSQFYRECLGHFLSNEPMMSMEDGYQLMKQLVAGIPLEAVNRYMSMLLPENDSNLVVVNFNNEKEGNVYPTEAQLLKAVSEARARQIEAYVDNVKSEPLIANLPKGGKVKKETRNEKMGYTTWVLSNGVRVNLKKTDYKKDEVRLRAEGPGGNTLYSAPADFANVKLFNQAIGISGLGGFSSTELHKALAGKNANADLSMSQKYTNVTGHATPKDVETMLQMVYLYFTNITKDRKSFDNMLGQYEVALKNRELSPEIAFSDSVSMTLYNHDAYHRPLLQQHLKQVSYDRILAMAKERTASAAGWTFNIVGNFDEAAIRPLVARYLGALATKGKAVKGHVAGLMTDANADNTFKRKMETPKSNAYMFWLTKKMDWTLERGIQADMAGQILSMVYLKKIREEAGAAYSCGAQGNFTYDPDDNQAMLVAVCPMKPEKADTALMIMRDEVPALARHCDSDMLAKVKEIAIKQLTDNQKTNGYWMNVMTIYDKYGIDVHTDNMRLTEAQSPEKIQAFMQELLKNGNRVSVVMMPE